MGSSPFVQGGGGVIGLSLTSNGTAVAGTIQVVSVSVKKTINKIPTAEIIILDGDMPGKDFPVSNTNVFKPGSAITIEAGYGVSAKVQIFAGIVIKHGIKITGDNYARLIIECRDAAVAMTIGRNNANFVNSKDSDIITKLIGNYSSLTSTVTATTTQYKELVQYYCTDWDFMLSRAEINGLLVIVDAAAISVKAPVTSGTPSLTVTYGLDLMEFHANIDARTQFTNVQGCSWDMKTQKAVTQASTPKTLNAQGDLNSATLAKIVGPASFSLQTPAQLETTALKAWVDGQQVKAGLARIQGKMSFQGSGLAQIGERIELVGVGSHFNGNVFVSSVHHTVANGNWITEVEFGMPQNWFAENRDLVAPSASGLLPGIEGLHIGVVMKLDADPDGQYKIQVSTPVMQAATDGVWARLANFYASVGIGAFFVPEIGDEVILGYLNNDPSNPVILGSLYSSTRQLPTPSSINSPAAYTLTADNFKKAIVTKSQLTVEFDDDKKIISLCTPGNNTIVISDDGKSILLQDQNNNMVKLSADGILLDSPKDISITAKGKITLTATGDMALSSKGDITAAGENITLTAKSGFTAKCATSEMTSSSTTAIKGSMVNIN